jgi:hypothetical protein
LAECLRGKEIAEIFVEIVGDKEEEEAQLHDIGKIKIVSSISRCQAILTERGESSFVC